MNYTAILDALNQVSLFDLYLLNAAIAEQPGTWTRVDKDKALDAGSHGLPVEQ